MTLDNPNILNDVLFSTPYSQSNTPLTPIIKTMLSSFDGFNSGVGAPTRTTATLTPTTLRNIEQTLFDYYPDDSNNSAPFQAGFVPPLAPAYQTTEVDPEYSMDSSSMSSSSYHTTPPPTVATEEIIIESAKQSIRNSNNSHTTKTSSRRNMGGRRPNKTSHLSPEEEEKRRVRRERNKLAAARCRRRREDHTNELLTEVEQLEGKKKELQLELQALQREKEEVEYLLQVHKPTCKRQIRDTNLSNVKTTMPTVVVSVNDKIKSEPVDTYEMEGPPQKRILLSSAVYSFIPSSTCSGMIQQLASAVQTNTTATLKPNRPNTLNVPMILQPSQALNTIAINTPSNGTFNFDSLMEGGTGLTPINYPLKALPDTTHTADLITPTTDASKLCSL